MLPNSSGLPIPIMMFLAASIPLALEMALFATELAVVLALLAFQLVAHPLVALFESCPTAKAPINRHEAKWHRWADAKINANLWSQNRISTRGASRADSERAKSKSAECKREDARSQCSTVAWGCGWLSGSLGGSNCSHGDYLLGCVPLRRFVSTIRCSYRIQRRELQEVIAGFANSFSSNRSESSVAIREKIAVDSEHRADACFGAMEEIELSLAISKRGVSGLFERCTERDCDGASMFR